MLRTGLVRSSLEERASNPSFMPAFHRECSSMMFTLCCFNLTCCVFTSDIIKDSHEKPQFTSGYMFCVFYITHVVCESTNSLNEVAALMSQCLISNAASSSQLALCPVARTKAGAGAQAGAWSVSDTLFVLGDGGQDRLHSCVRREPDTP